MSIRQMELRRAELLAKIAQQRQELDALSHALSPYESRLDRGYRLIQKISEHPVMAVGGSLLFMVVFRRHARVIKIGLLALSVSKMLFRSQQSALK